MRRYIPELKLLRSKDFITLNFSIPNEILQNLRYFMGIAYAKGVDSTTLYIMGKGPRDLLKSLDKPSMYASEDKTGFYFETPRPYWGEIKEA